MKRRDFLKGSIAGGILSAVLSRKSEEVQANEITESPIGITEDKSAKEKCVVACTTTYCPEDNSKWVSYDTTATYADFCSTSSSRRWRPNDNMS